MALIWSIQPKKASRRRPAATFSSRLAQADEPGRALTGRHRVRLRQQRAAAGPAGGRIVTRAGELCRLAGRVVSIPWPGWRRVADAGRAEGRWAGGGTA
jgi:hypothetical protein